MDTTLPTTAETKWKPLNPTQRRVVGVLVEKAKTTPEQYPLSLNGLTTGCNQKNNRQPVTELSSDQVQEALEELRELGAVLEVQGTGRVAKYKHCLYEWLGVDKVELAVMAELLLRGEQTVGELRGRAARMEPIGDLQALRPILQSLKEKGLVRELTPEGRGQLVTHNLYKDRELAELQSRVQQVEVTPREHSPVATIPSGVTLDMFHELQLEVVELRAEVSRLRGIVQEWESKVPR
jgi:uncharacterized protein YceH (UPF0502 family)